MSQKENAGKESSDDTDWSPLHNAMAERVNNTIKNGWLFDCEDKSFNKVKILVDKTISIYNNQRPHQALQMKTPIQAMEELVNIAS